MMMLVVNRDYHAKIGDGTVIESCLALLYITLACLDTEPSPD